MNDKLTWADIWELIHGTCVLAGIMFPFWFAAYVIGHFIAKFW